MPELQPLRLTVADLQNLCSICENEIRLVEFANTVFGVENATAMRAIASNLQVRLEQEITRQVQLAQARQEEESRKQGDKKPEPEPAKA